MAEPKIRFKNDDGSAYAYWNQTSFKENFDALNNNTFSRDLLNYDNGEAKNIHYGDILVKYGDLCDIQSATVPYVNDGNNIAKYASLQDGDVILADTAEDETVGKAIEIVNICGDTVVSGLHTMACRPTKKFASGYLGYYMNSSAFHRQLFSLMQGIKVLSISRSNIANTNVCYPSSLEEQQKIASFFADLDEVIQTSEAEVAALEKQKKGVMQKIFSQEVRFKKNDGSDYPEWEEMKLEDVVDFLDKKRKPLEGSKRISGIYPYYGASGIVDYVKDYIFDGETILLSEDGANIVTRTYRVCFLATGKYWVNNHAHVLKAKEGNVNRFICEQLERLDYSKYNTGTAQPKLNQEVCKNLPLMIPIKEEQQKIADFLSSFDEAIDSAKQELEKWKLLKKGLLQQMFV